MHAVPLENDTDETSLQVVNPRQHDATIVNFIPLTFKVSLCLVEKKNWSTTNSKILFNDICGFKKKEGMTSTVQNITPLFATKHQQFVEADLGYLLPVGRVTPGTQHLSPPGRQKR